MTTANPSIIEVTEHAWSELVPQAAIVHARLTASKLFTGRAPIANAAELRRLADALAARDLPEDALALDGVALDVSSGLFTRSSSVTYRVRIHVRDVDRVPAVIDAIAACKDATLSHVFWDYTGDSPAMIALLATCAARALAKAQTIADALEVTIDGVHEVHEHVEPDPAPAPAPMACFDAPVARRRSESVERQLAGLELAPRKQHGVSVRLVCRIAPRAAPARAT